MLKLLCFSFQSQMNEERGDHLHALAAKEQELQEKLDAVSAECQMEIQVSFNASTVRTCHF